MTNTISLAQQVFNIEIEALKNVQSLLDNCFKNAVDLILNSNGRVIICGMGKSGHIANKIAATMASTGTPAFFMHPGEAYHGDLGMVLPNDVFIAISNSGETEEVIRLIPFIKENGNRLIAITSNASSTLAVNADCHMSIKVPREACALNLAPSSSTTATLVVGDALAIALMKKKEFKEEHFARFHPGGSLGKKLLDTVEKYVSEIVFVSPSSNILDLVLCFSRSKGGVVVVGDKNKVLGICTEGDLRRSVLFLLEGEGKDITVEKLMSKDPITVASNCKCSDADNLMRKRKINSLIVMKDGIAIGIYSNLNS
ncbi:Arabinose 5-phosphate isomerase KdsD [invertebrate metagenome]|uniref:Arabinose 5-phosphate isomerase KdsD n=1 Tax=invertebrate metagenome TaxID=1711999 RepID=A0A2H9T322_9ZZZZ